MDEHDEGSGFRARGEDALNELAEALLENPLLGQAVKGALGAGERALQAQRQALSAMDIATAGDVERVVKRVRSLSERIDALEDTVDALARELGELRQRADASGGSRAAAED